MDTKKAVLMILGELMLFASYGQIRTNEKTGGKIIGKVVDSATNRPIEYATISLYRAAKSTLLNGTTSDSSGNFTLTKVPQGHYDVVIKFVGFRTITLKDIIVDQS